jgi:TRAP-type C4-dicarboxylate transport system permease small subunit
MHRLARAWQVVAGLCESLCGLALVAIAAITLYEIVSRALFDSPTLWAQDVSVFLLIGLAFIGLLPTDRAGRHIRIDVWYKRLSLPAQHALERLAYLATAAFAALAAWTGGEIVLQSVRYGRRTLSLFSVPLWIPQSALVVGFALFALECLRRALSRTAGRTPDHQISGDRIPIAPE